MTRRQLSRMPDGSTYFWVARTLRRGNGGYHAARTMLVGLGCEATYARELV
jgi:predicted transcriptional regulator